jgi:predicted unusual protein kinase regulating ubiquinone biosynthesis (AarF/ABC1/UbiB family)
MGRQRCPRAARQVYKAVLRDTGEDVAIKVQRPGVRPVILRDLFIFRSMARFINPISKVCSRPSLKPWRRNGPW